MSTPRANSSGGVKSLRAMFENPDASTPATPLSPGESRGRSSAAGSNAAGETPIVRPLSTVRTSFVSVQSGAQQGSPVSRSPTTSLGGREEGKEARTSVGSVLEGTETVEGSDAAVREETVPETVPEARVEDKALVGELSERLQGLKLSEKEQKKEEKKEAKKAEKEVKKEKKVEAKKEETPVGVAPSTRVKEAETPSPKKSEVKKPAVQAPAALEPKVREPKTETHKVEAEKVEAPKIQEPKVEESEIQEPKVEEPKVEEHRVEESRIEEEKVEKPKIEEPKVQDPATKEAEKPKPVESLKVATEEAPSTLAAAPKSPTRAKTNETPSKPAASTLKPKTQSPAVAKTTPKPLEKTNGNTKLPTPKPAATARAVSPAAKPVSKPAHISTAKPTTKPASITPKSPLSPAHKGSPKASRSSLRASTSSNASTATSHHPSTGFVKPRPKSPTRPVKLPAHLVAPTASSAAKLRDGTAPPAPARSLSRKSSTIARAPKQPHSTIGPPSAPRRVSSRTSLGSNAGDRPHAARAPDEGFLARMMRPTQSSASKVREQEPAPAVRRAGGVARAQNAQTGRTIAKPGPKGSKPLRTQVPVGVSETVEATEDPVHVEVAGDATAEDKVEVMEEAPAALIETSVAEPEAVQS